MMRRVVQIRTLRLHARMSSSYLGGSRNGGGGGTRRSNREQTLDGAISDVDMKNADVFSSGGKRPSTIAKSTKNFAPKMTSDAEVLFPDAQEFEVNDVEGVEEDALNAHQGSEHLNEKEDEVEARPPRNIKRRYVILKQKAEPLVLVNPLSKKNNVLSWERGENEEEDVTQIYENDEITKNTSSTYHKRVSPKTLPSITPSSNSRATVNAFEDDDNGYEDDVTRIYETSMVKNPEKMTTLQSRAPGMNPLANHFTITTTTTTSNKARTENIDKNNDDNSGDGKDDDDGDDEMDLTKISKNTYNMSLAATNDNHCAGKRGSNKVNSTNESDSVDCHKRAMQNDEVVMMESDDLAREDNTGTDSDELKAVRDHAFFNALIHRMEKNAACHKQQIKTSGRYTLDVVNQSVRPILQLIDYPLTVRQLGRMASFVYPKLLKRSLSDLKSCRRLCIYHSADTGVLLDWSVESFLRQRYESIHVSWEPVKVICMRLGWDPTVMTDRDCLLYFSEFAAYVELAELEQSAGDDKPKAVLIEDPVRTAEQRPIPVSRLLIRRKLSKETELSLTETIRLMGAPALRNPIKSRKPRTLDKDTVDGMFERIQREADAVDGDDATKLRHGLNIVPSLRQASHPAGRSIREFSIPKSKSSMFDSNMERPIPDSGEGVKQNGKAFDENRCGFVPEAYEVLANAYHKKKVEVSQIRRRLMSTDSIDLASELQERLERTQKELPRLREQLDRMRQQRRAKQEVGNPNSSMFIPSHPSSRRGDTNPDAKGGSGSNKGFAKTPESCAILQTTNAVSCPQGADTYPVEDQTMVTNSHHVMKSELSMLKIPPAEATEESTKTKYDHSTVDVGTNVCNNGKRFLDNTKKKTSDMSTGDIRSLSAAAMMLRQEIVSLQERRRQEESALLQKMEEALGALFKIENVVKTVTQRNTNEMGKEEEEEVEEVERLRKEMEAKAEAEAVAAAELEQRRLDAEREEAERKAKAEARARALEEELLRQHEERVRLLNRQREEARIAQREAELALERQREAERKTLAEEEELRRQLEEAKSRIWNGDTDSANLAVVGLTAGSTMEKSAEESLSKSNKNIVHTSNTALKVDTAKSPEKVDNITPTPRQRQAVPRSSGPTCTQEQYDGLQLGAQRLRKEIAELERQMEKEGDEDDMTLMAVLAASRADLEELEEFIRLVQEREPWAAERDRVRIAEEERQMRQRGDKPSDLQDLIAATRFQVELMEKRVQHATERSVITKLEQGIVNGRREINRLRIEQDRLRRSGKYADAGGLRMPASLSVADAIAAEERAAAKAKAEEEEEEGEGEGEEDKMATKRYENHGSRNLNNNNKNNIDKSDNNGNMTMNHDNFDNQATNSEMTVVESQDTHLNPTEDNSDDIVAMKDADEGSTLLTDSSDTAHEGASDERAFKVLTSRLESMLEGIKRLEERVASNELGDDMATSALEELQLKLQKLLEMRDAIKRRMSSASSPLASPRLPMAFAPMTTRPVVSGSGKGAPSQTNDAELLRFGKTSSAKSPVSATTAAVPSVPQRKGKGALTRARRTGGGRR